MYHLLRFTVRYGPQIGGWVLTNRGPLAEIIERFSGAVAGSFTGGTQRLDRIGGALVAVEGNQREVIGLLHRHEDKLDGVGRAVEGLAAGQAGLAESLDLLTSLSAVTLGFSVLTPVLLLSQFRILHRRFDSLSREVKAIQERLDLRNSAELNAGLTFLAQSAGDGADCETLLQQALMELTRADLYYSAFLESELAKGGQSDRDLLWLLTRHLTMAVLGLAACHLRRKEPRRAEATLRKGMATMIEHAAAVFGRTVGSDPMRYLMPAMREHGATLEGMAELYRQAGHAGILASANGSTSDFFEGQRGRLANAADPVFYKGSTVARLRAELAEATAAVEEVNRVQGLWLTLRHCAKTGVDYSELERRILADLEASRPIPGECYAFFHGAETEANAPAKSQG